MCRANVYLIAKNMNFQTRPDPKIKSDKYQLTVLSHFPCFIVQIRHTVKIITEKTFSGNYLERNI
jgi:hypothetical protein